MSADQTQGRDAVSSPVDNAGGEGGYTLLVAEDNLGDFVLLSRMLTRMNVQCNVVRAEDGRHAVDYLAHCGDPPLQARPSHFLLDLKMPMLSGFEVLSWLRSEPRFRDLPVIVLSSSSIDADVAKVEDLKVDAYLVKPSGLDELAHVVRKIVDIWHLPYKPL